MEDANLASRAIVYLSAIQEGDDCVGRCETSQILLKNDLWGDRC